jgi:hypothetical protein
MKREAIRSIRKSTPPGPGRRPTRAKFAYQKQRRRVRAELRPPLWVMNEARQAADDSLANEFGQLF